MRRYFIGVDLGQSRDYTAIAVLEWEERKGAWDPVTFAWRKETALSLRYMERPALGTPYPELVERVVEVAQWPGLNGRRYLAVDATGVGRPVVDLLRRARPGCTMMPVVITGGDAETQADGYYRTPKRDLITGLQVALQCGRLRIAAGVEHGETLVKEMREMRVKTTAAGREQYEAWREGSHDDLVLAVALACWAQRKVCPDGRKQEWWASGVG